MAYETFKHDVLVIGSGSFTHNLGEGIALATQLAIQVRGHFAWKGSREDVDVADFERLYHRVVEGRA